MRCPICDSELVADEPEEGIARLRCSRCHYEEEREVHDGYWF